jgi:hypothetical protein
MVSKYILDQKGQFPESVFRAVVQLTSAITMRRPPISAATPKERAKHGCIDKSCLLEATNRHNRDVLLLNAVQAQVQSCSSKFWQRSQICQLHHSAARIIDLTYLAVIPGAAAAIPRRQLPVSRKDGPCQVSWGRFGTRTSTQQLPVAGVQREGFLITQIVDQDSALLTCSALRKAGAVELEPSKLVLGLATAQRARACRRRKYGSNQLCRAPERPLLWRNPSAPKRCTYHNTRHMPPPRKETYLLKHHHGKILIGGG